MVVPKFGFCLISSNLEFEASYRLVVSGIIIHTQVTLLNAWVVSLDVNFDNFDRFSWPGVSEVNFDKIPDDISDFVPVNRIYSPRAETMVGGLPRAFR